MPAPEIYTVDAVVEVAAREELSSEVLSVATNRTRAVGIRAHLPEDLAVPDIVTRHASDCRAAFAAVCGGLRPRHEHVLQCSKPLLAVARLRSCLSMQAAALVATFNYRCSESRVCTRLRYRVIHVAAKASHHVEASELASVVKMRSPVLLDAGSKPRLQAPTTRHTPSGLRPHLICTGAEVLVCSDPCKPM